MGLLPQDNIIKAVRYDKTIPPLSDSSVRKQFKFQYNYKKWNCIWENVKVESIPYIKNTGTYGIATLVDADSFNNIQYYCLFGFELIISHI